ncbi:MAG TPA: hypothetical protein VNA12_06555 [Mycobacteriales bacterium]|nr:hypothetical protein [Mycobacteriales bacterium]
MPSDAFLSGPVDPLPYRSEIARPEPAPFQAGDPRDAVRAELHRRFTSPGTGSWDYLESTVRGDVLVVRLLDDTDGYINIEVELADPVRPEDWQFLDVWIVELMDTGRPAPASVVDGMTTYRLD